MEYNDDYETGLEYAEEPEVAMQINRELALARRIVEETGTNLFLTGKAGTGKTTFLRRLRDESGKRMVVLAPTGVAAINAGGMTIHSFFQLPFAPFVPGRGFLGEEKRFMRIGKEKRRLISSLDLIVIDEISMVRPDILDGVDSILRRMRGNDSPFGGVQLLLIGDLRQLAPVVKPDEWSLLRDYYSSPYFFESMALKQAGFVAVELKHIYRQQDPGFISLLNAIRDGHSDMDTLNRLNARFRPMQSQMPRNVIRLTTHNRTSDEVNRRNLDALPGRETTFEANVTGKFPESSFPAERFLTLKEGARVMFIKNDTGTARRYYNGLIGTVTHIGEESVTVRPDDRSLPPIEAAYTDWENISYSIDEATRNITQHVDGVFSQLPLRLAWAITIHKSQGLTFDNAIIDASHSFAPGQLYVALSRCRTLEGMVLESPVASGAVIIDRVVNTFIEESERNKPDDAAVDRLRDEYCRSLLASLFDFRALTNAFLDFRHAVEEFVAPMMPELYESYRTQSAALRERVDGVGQRFISLYASRPVNASDLAADTQFMEKIRNGCRYFLEQLAPVRKLLNDTPLDVDNKAYQRRLDNVVEPLRLEMGIKLSILKGMLTDDFSPETYMKHKAIAVLSASENPKADKGVGKVRKKQEKQEKVAVKAEESSEMPDKKTTAKKEKVKKEKKPKGYSQRISLKLWREGKDIGQIAKERELSPTTIALHLVEMVKVGELEETDILGAEDKEKVAGIERKSKDKDGKVDYTLLKENMASEGLPQYLYTIYHQLS